MASPSSHPCAHTQTMLHVTFVAISHIYIYALCACDVA